MSSPTPSQSVSHKRFHQCVNHEKNLSLRYPLLTFGSFSFFQASIWLGVSKVLHKWTKSWFPGNVRVKPQFNTQCPRPLFWYPLECSFGKEFHPLWMTSTFHYVLTSSCNGQELSINTISSGTKAREASMKNNSTTNILKKETLFLKKWHIFWLLK